MLGPLAAGFKESCLKRRDGHLLLDRGYIRVSLNFMILSVMNKAHALGFPSWGFAFLYLVRQICLMLLHVKKIVHSIYTQHDFCYWTIPISRLLFFFVQPNAGDARNTATYYELTQVPAYG